MVFLLLSVSKKSGEWILVIILLRCSVRHNVRVFFNVGFVCVAVRARARVCVCVCVCSSAFLPFLYKKIKVVELTFYLLRSGGASVAARGRVACRVCMLGEAEGRG